MIEISNLAGLKRNTISQVYIDVLFVEIIVLPLNACIASSTEILKSFKGPFVSILFLCSLESSVDSSPSSIIPPSVVDNSNVNEHILISILQGCNLFYLFSFNTIKRVF